MTEFTRTNSKKKIRLGYGSRRHTKWRRARGKHNKIRESIRGKPAKVKAGYRNEKSTRGKVQGLIPIMVRNIHDLHKVKKENIAILAKFGKKKKAEIDSKIKELGIKVLK